MRALRPLQSTALLACLLLGLSPASAQEPKPEKQNSASTEKSHGAKSDDAASAPPARRSPRGRQWSLALERQIPLPGPLPAGTPRLTEAGVELLVAGGTALVDWNQGLRLSVAPGSTAADNAAEAESWATSPNGKYRFQAQGDGWIVAQKRCKRCRKPPWRRKWKLRVSGTAPVAPVATDKRVFFGAMDNRIYSLRVRNGHRVWATDIKGRPLRGLVLAHWQPPPPLGSEEFDPPEPPAEPLELILAIPGDGHQLLALNAETGAKVADFTVDPAKGRLVGQPVMTIDGAILVGRSDYDEEQAALVVLRLKQVAGVPSGKSDDVEYTGPPAPDRSPEKGQGKEGASP